MQMNWAALSFGTVYICCVWCHLFYLFIYLFIYLFQSVAEIIKESDHSIKSYREVFPCGAVFKALRFY